MKRLRRGSTSGRCCVLWAGVACVFAFQPAFAADFSVTSPGSSYSINGQGPNPTLTVVRGGLYTFAVGTSSFHPFRILNSTGVTNNNISNGTITWRVPTNAANYAYDCSIHHFGGTILTVAPPSPPTIQILSLTLTTNIVLRSTGTDTWSVIPEFSTNLSTTNWFGLAVQTNNFANGTNETICGRPSGDSVFIRIKARQN